jgi:hypothetical protein
VAKVELVANINSKRFTIDVVDHLSFFFIVKELVLEVVHSERGVFLILLLLRIEWSLLFY